MYKKLFPLVLFLSILISISAYPAEEQNVIPPQVFSAEEISEFEKKFREIDLHMTYLKDKMVEHNDIITMYTDSERLFRELKTSPEISDLRLAKEHLNSKLVMLEDKAKQKAAYIKRMDFMYQSMVIMGLAIIVFMAVYSIYMYLRRK